MNKHDIAAGGGTDTGAAAIPMVGGTAIGVTTAATDMATDGAIAFGAITTVTAGVIVTGGAITAGGTATGTNTPEIRTTRRGVSNTTRSMGITRIAATTITIPIRLTRSQPTVAVMGRLAATASASAGGEITDDQRAPDNHPGALSFSDYPKRSSAIVIGEIPRLALVSSTPKRPKSSVISNRNSDFENWSSGLDEGRGSPSNAAARKLRDTGNF